MITRILILHCERCDRTTRIKGSGVTDDGLCRVAQERRWLIVRHPDPTSVYSPEAYCPDHAKQHDGRPHWAVRAVDRG